MARNTGRGYRIGALRGRTQSYNAHNGRWVKRSAITGRIMDVKANPQPFKGIRKS